MIDSKNSTELELAPSAAHEYADPLEDEWFADRRSGSLPPPRITSVPPIGDDDVDIWLR